MTVGPRLCACCGSAEGVEAHHLYSRRAGCPDDITVWLCNVCHGRAHGMKRRPNSRVTSRQIGTDVFVVTAHWDRGASR